VLDQLMFPSHAHSQSEIASKQGVGKRLALSDLLPMLTGIALLYCEVLSRSKQAVLCVRTQLLIAPLVIS
jgi:hypothetical protein